MIEYLIIYQGDSNKKIVTFKCIIQKILTKHAFREVVVAQLVEVSLPIPEVRISNPVNGINLFISNICLLSTVY